MYVELLYPVLVLTEPKHLVLGVLEGNMIVDELWRSCVIQRSHDTTRPQCGRCTFLSVLSDISVSQERLIKHLPRLTPMSARAPTFICFDPPVAGHPRSTLVDAAAYFASLDLDGLARRFQVAAPVLRMVSLKLKGLCGSRNGRGSAPAHLGPPCTEELSWRRSE
ncbi:uncharacterized protein BXZ73DRAFT_76600 [Epithele typhae]|uniref:uncharacterized protein n=1 Tax=Epithele typhae TaxID=378194 RepID=UPI0020082DBB|nr:uncharacterized protein BXZ73DRAFT_76600 [Epithele typhae]KAH9936783.1 hypothetical protein BXZ73DRAFT_76600 [Epithele typhae]